jgi:hypothetical protein
MKTYMLATKTPLIIVGQLYLHPQLDEYVIVTNNNRGHISYEGGGFKGQAESETFIERFGPVDPADVSEDELKTLLSYCPTGTRPLVGFIS